MSDREKYRTRGGYYLANREPRKAIEEYLSLVQQFPSDGAGYSNLALAYFYLRDMPKALEEGRHAVELLPKALLQLNNLALYAVYAGDFATAADQARKVIAQNSSYVNAYGGLAMAQSGQGRLGEAEQTYQKMEAISARGAEMAMMGRADLLLYQGRTKEAIALLQKASALTAGKTDDSTLATYLILLAQAKLAAGKASDAVADAKSALTHDSGGPVLYSAARVYIEAGQGASPQLLASQLSSHLDADDQAYAKLLEGEAYLKRGEAQRSIPFFEEAQKLSDSWMGRLDLGRAYVEMGRYTEADSELEKCLKRRGEASALFLDDVPTFRVVPLIYYYLARAQEGLKSPAATDSYKSFLAIKEKSDESGLVADARRRVAEH
jgi:tetratricopeptide (TPR) repeat protein